MPALITHRLFGEESIDALPQGIIGTEDERIAFLIANQGPDPYFFRVRTPRLASCMELARAMHRCRPSRQFAALRDGVSHLQRHDAALGRAFALGLLSHYVLDRTAHPFVYAQQWGVQGTDESLEGVGSQVHAIIESDLDELMLQLKRDGATVTDYPPESTLVTSKRIDKVAGTLMSFIGLKVYGLSVGAAEYGRSVADMRMVYRAIEPAGSPLSNVIDFAETATRGASLLASLAHRVTTVQPYRAGNMGHLSWSDPFTGEESHESFPEVFERALAGYRDAAARFIESDDMEGLTRHLNYSGRPLDVCEEYERDE